MSERLVIENKLKNPPNNLASTLIRRGRVGYLVFTSPSAVPGAETAFDTRVYRVTGHNPREVFPSKNASFESWGRGDDRFGDFEGDPNATRSYHSGVVKQVALLFQP